MQEANQEQLRAIYATTKQILQFVIEQGQLATVPAGYAVEEAATSDTPLTMISETLGHIRCKLFRDGISLIFPDYDRRWGAQETATKIHGGLAVCELLKHLTSQNKVGIYARNERAGFTLSLLPDAASDTKEATYTFQDGLAATLKALQETDIQQVATGNATIHDAATHMRNWN